ncbi:MAG TPA: hypothetical protein VMW83_06240 [Spirochaetia bacterium]|nr:hypothetical protein [Spirochaetia bacterium]
MESDHHHGYGSLATALQAWENLRPYRLLLSRYEAYLYSLCYRLTGRREEAVELTREPWFHSKWVIDIHSSHR